MLLNPEAPQMKQRFYLLAHHVLNPLLYLGKGGGFTAVVQHGHHRLHTSEHLSQHLVLVGQGETGGGPLGKAVIALERWDFTAKTNTRTDI